MDKPTSNKAVHFPSGQNQPSGALSLRRPVRFCSGVDKSGTEMNKSEFNDMIRKMVASDETDMGVRRCIYENDDILVMHSVNDYPDGTREAVLMSCIKTDGRISRVETGATPIQK